MYRSLCALTLVGGLGSASLAQLSRLPEVTAGVEDAGPACDSAAIRWHLPGTFEEAWQRAQDENRLLLIKGISFGVDDAGASCATRGKW